MKAYVISFPGYQNRFALSLFNLDHFSPFIGTTIEANVMREFGFMTLRAGSKARELEFKMGPTSVPPGLGYLVFWISHRFYLPPLIFKKLL